MILKNEVSNANYGASATFGHPGKTIRSVYGVGVVPAASNPAY